MRENPCEKVANQISENLRERNLGGELVDVSILGAGDCAVVYIDSAHVRNPTFAVMRKWGYEIMGVETVRYDEEYPEVIKLTFMA